MDKGTLSNCISAVVLAVGAALSPGPAQGLVLSAGLFAFSGASRTGSQSRCCSTVSPGLIGSGVIPARFKEIRRQVKELIVEHFFDEAHLRRFFAEHQQDIDWKQYLKQGEGGSPQRAMILKQWDKLTAPDVVQPVIDQQIEKLAESSIGGMLMMVGLDNVRPAVNQFVTSFVESMQDKVLAAAEEASDDIKIELDEEKVVTDIRAKVETLLETKLEQLRAEDVKQMMEDVMRRHLGWLIVWGNVFGGLIGVAAYFVQH